MPPPGTPRELSSSDLSHYVQCDAYGVNLDWAYPALHCEGISVDFFHLAITKHSGCHIFCNEVGLAIPVHFQKVYGYTVHDSSSPVP